jgi:hypothetical protein
LKEKWTYSKVKTTAKAHIDWAAKPCPSSVFKKQLKKEKAYLHLRDFFKNYIHFLQISQNGKIPFVLKKMLTLFFKCLITAFSPFAICVYFKSFQETSS